MNTVFSEYSEIGGGEQNMHFKHVQVLLVSLRHGTGPGNRRIGPQSHVVRIFFFLNTLTATF